jgi:hypothetical protein
LATSKESLTVSIPMVQPAAPEREKAMPFGRVQVAGAVSEMVPAALATAAWLTGLFSKSTISPTREKIAPCCEVSRSLRELRFSRS